MRLIEPINQTIFVDAVGQRWGFSHDGCWLVRSAHGIWRRARSEDFKNETLSIQWARNVSYDEEDAQTTAEA
jgi:hypothetical protein